MSAHNAAWPLKILMSGCLWMGGPGLALAQVPNAEGIAPEGEARPTLWLQPRALVGVNLSNNGKLQPTNESAETILELSTGIRLVVNRPSIQGDVDYALSSRSFSQGSSSNEVRHTLNADTTFNIWNDRLFVDAEGVVEDQALSAFRSQQGVLLRDANRTQASSFRLSPHVIGTFSQGVDYELRYSLRHDGNEFGNRADIDTRELSFQVGRSMEGQKFGWAFRGYSQQVDYALTQRNKLSRVSGSVLYAATPELMLSLLAGIESNDVLSIQRKSYSNIGLNLEWQPSPQTRIVARAEDRFYGNGHTLALEHRTGRTVWRIFSTRRIDSETPLDAAATSIGSAGSVLRSLLASQFPNDPVGLEREIARYLNEWGISPDQQLTQNFFTAATSLEDRLEVSVGYFGVRSSIRLALARVRTKRLGTAINLGDDFDNNAEVRQWGVGVRYGYRLTPQTALDLSFSRQRNTGTAANAHTRLSSASVGLTTRFTRRTSGSVQLRHTRYAATVNPYNETAIAGVITHQF